MEQNAKQHNERWDSVRWKHRKWKIIGKTKWSSSNVNGRKFVFVSARLPSGDSLSVLFFVFRRVKVNSVSFLFFVMWVTAQRQSDYFSSFIMLETIEKAPENFLWFDLNIWTLGCIRTSFHSTSSVETAEWNVVKMLVRSQSACRSLIMSWDTCGLELSVYIFSTLILCLFISLIVKSKWMRRLR